MDKSRITYLYNLYLSKGLSPSELGELKTVLSDSRYENQLSELIDLEWTQLQEEMLLEVTRENMDSGFASIVAHPKRQKKTVTLWPRFAAAVAIIIMVGAGIFLEQYQRTKQSNKIAQNDIKPGSNKAILILANGQKIVLTGAANGTLADQSGVKINKTNDGELVYSASDDALAALAYNTAETPQGGQYQVTLADGTKVWLNASSSLKYPTQFNGKERLVELTGEAYFEVAKDKQHPFIVHTALENVRVLGTHFNVNAYKDEPATKTTLLEGSVQLTVGALQKMLKPGQQALLSHEHINVKDVDTEEAVAWKNGYFMFSNEDLGSVMRKLSRWYDVDVHYDDESLKQEIIWGTMTRFANVSKVLHMLELTKAVKFKIENNKTIMVYRNKN